MSGERQIEMTWRCSACGESNLGRHMKCQRCGDPKEDAEQYEMPTNTAAAATVTDPRLLRMATAGANWRCWYCSTDQRALDGNCGQCGAPPREAPAAAAFLATRAQAAKRARTPWGMIVAGVGGGVVLLVAAGSVLGALSRGTTGTSGLVGSIAPPVDREIDARVSAVAWETDITVERFHVIDGAGFAEARPADAFEVKTVDQRVHHMEKVSDGTRPESYTETVPDGYTTTTYSDRVACGQDCTTRPQTCKETCTSGKNGFASCKTTCTGGGQDCSTRYCNETKTKQVPKTKTVTKTREIPAFKDEPRMAPWFSWKARAWTVDRHVEERGTTQPPIWAAPTRVHLKQGIAKGEDERELRSGKFTVVFDAEGRSYKLTPASEDVFKTFDIGATRRIRVPVAATSDVVLEVLGTPSTKDALPP
jgi:hypothetical protein